jgi:hypothetical protein
MIQSLKEEILEAQKQGNQSKLQFALDSVEVELSISVTKTRTGKGNSVSRFRVCYVLARQKSRNIINVSSTCPLGYRKTSFSSTRNSDSTI